VSGSLIKSAGMATMGKRPQPAMRVPRYVPSGISIARIDAPAVVTERQSERLLVTSAERTEQTGRGRPRRGRLAPDATVTPFTPDVIAMMAKGSAWGESEGRWFSS
jgi:hypothetical protein